MALSEKSASSTLSAGNSSPADKVINASETIVPVTKVGDVAIPANATIDLSKVDLSSQTPDFSKIIANARPSATELTVDLSRPAAGNLTMDHAASPAGDHSSGSLGGKSTEKEEIKVGDELRLGGDRFTITKIFNNGAHGVVYKATGKQLKRDVALKRLRPGKAGSTGESGALDVAREAQALASMDHPNIVKIYGLHKKAKEHWFIYEFVNGQGLDEHLKTNPVMEPKQAALLGVKLASALDEVHKKGLCHRDVKPANVIVSDKMEPRLVDFGVAMSTGEGKPTGSSLVAGTTSYMAPEVARAWPLLDNEKGVVPPADVDQRADIFSLGMVLLEVLTGKQAYKSDDNTTLNAMLLQAASSTPVPISKIDEKKIPPELLKVIRKALQKDPEKRYKTAAEMQADLDTYLESTRSTSWRSRVVISGMGAAVATGLVGTAALLHQALKEPEKPLPPQPTSTANADPVPKPEIKKTEVDIVALEHWKVADDKTVSILKLMEPFYQKQRESRPEFRHRDPESGNMIKSPNTLENTIRHYRYFTFDTPHPDDVKDRKKDMPKFIANQLKGLIATLDATTEFTYSQDLPFNMPTQMYESFLSANNLTDSPALRENLERGIREFKELAEGYKEAASKELQAMNPQPDLKVSKSR